MSNILSKHRYIDSDISTSVQKLYSSYREYTNKHYISKCTVTCNPMIRRVGLNINKAYIP